MYAQVTIIHAPVDGMPRMRQIIENDYLNAIRSRPGFISAELLEQVDDPEAALLIVYWSNHEAVENFNRTGLLDASVQAIAARMPGVRVMRQGYVIHLHVTPEPAGAAD